ncbi:MAG: hypothetical protein OXD30_12425 [Bryobacterales bacterium]|nr:hypothetical protein [Bryobacterales bacterium]
MSKKFLKAERISIKNDAELSEKWVQDIIADDPSILGIGDLQLLAQELKQPRAGRLDLLFEDTETARRYEVELQLGPTDETHIIRTIEYWDIQKKRWPQYEHCAVLVAEDITSRFLNVVSLFNGTMPLIAIQMQALKIGDNLTLVFTKVMDEFSRGLVNEDRIEAPKDRKYWVNKATESTVYLTDKILEILRDIDSTLNLNYNKFYIGIEKEGKPYNFVRVMPKKTHLIFEIRLPQSEDIDTKLDETDLSILQYNKYWGVYRLRLNSVQIEGKANLLKELSELAYKEKLS